jgi:TDG/mug DNA glycosylase family protein
VQANNFEVFLQQQSSIKTCLFNGQAAHKLFKQHLGKEFLLQRDIATECLPSTSPAHASVSREKKLEIWSAALEKALAL